MYQPFYSLPAVQQGLQPGQQHGPPPLAGFPFAPHSSLWGGPGYGMGGAQAAEQCTEAMVAE